MLPHASAEPDIRAGFTIARVPWAPRPAVSIQAIAAHESAYGTYPGRQGMPRTNWGANHCKKGEPGHRANDRRFEPGKGWVSFPTCFAVPPSNGHGVALIIDFFKSRGALGAINQEPRKVALSMAKMGYYDPAAFDQYADSLAALSAEMVRTVPAYRGLALPPPNPMQKAGFSKPGGQVVKAGILTGPETTKSYMRRVDIEYDAFNADMMKEFNLKGPNWAWPLDFFNAWLKQHTAWKTFFNANIDGFFTGWSAAEHNETAEYEQQLIDYRTKAKGYGMGLTTPDPPKPDNGPTFGIPWNGLLIVGGLAAGGWILSNLRSGKR